MSLKDDIIALINSAYRHDKFINDFTEAISTVFNRLIVICESIRNNTFFDSLDLNGILWWENHLKITPTPSQTSEDRKAKIQAKYLSKYHNSVDLLQRICNGWKNGEVEVDFVNGKFEIQFVGSFGVPSDLDSLKESIEETKPAHLPIVWIYRYLIKREIHHVLTKSQMQTFKKGQYCNMGIGE